MKLLLTLILLSVCILAARAQNIKDDRISVAYLQLPTRPLRAHLKTYRKNIELLGLQPTDSRETLIRSINAHLDFNKRDFKEVQSGADMELYIRLEEFRSTSISIESVERSETKSDKTIVKRKYFVANCQMTYPFFLRIRAIRDDSTIFEGYINNSQSYTSLRSGEWIDAESARKDMVNIIAKAKESFFSETLDAVQAKLINEYSYHETFYKLGINYVASNKKTNYDDTATAKDSTILALSSIKGHTLEVPADTKIRLQRCIELWENILKESAPDDRKSRIDKKVTVALCENVAYCYLFLQNFTQAESYVQKARVLDRKIWQDDISRFIESQRRRFKANNIAYN
jgi:hypothetical protein